MYTKYEAMEVQVIFTKRKKEKGPCTNYIYPNVVLSLCLIPFLILPLKGAKGERLLVYEYVPNGSLLEYITGKSLHV